MLVSAILIIGIQESARVNAVIVVLKVSVAVLFIVLGWAYINPGNYTPFIPPNTGEFGQFGWSGVLRGAGKVFFAFIGFDAVSTAAQEAKKPQRDMPIGIVGSLAVCTVLYIVFSHVLTGIVSYKDLNVAAPVAVAIDRTAVHLAAAGGEVRDHPGLHFRDSGDAAGPEPGVLLHVARPAAAQGLQRHPSASSARPGGPIILFMVFTGVFAAFAPLSALGDMTSIGTLFAFVLVCIGIMVMRKHASGTPPALPDAAGCRWCRFWASRSICS